MPHLRNRKMSKIKEHFENIAESYDYFKEKNSYFYTSLKKLYKQLIPDSQHKRILEIGCGTGDLISYLKPKYGVGTDISNKMIDIAKKKHPKIKFKVMSAEELKINERFDYIFLADVVEHLSDVEKTINNLRKISDKDAIIIFTMGNVMWGPILILAEKLGLKMPEGPHHRISFKKLNTILKRNNFRVVKRGYRLLIPKKIFFIHQINYFFYKIPIIRKLGLIEYIILKTS